MPNLPSDTQAQPYSRPCMQRRARSHELSVHVILPCCSVNVKPAHARACPCPYWSPACTSKLTAKPNSNRGPIYYEQPYAFVRRLCLLTSSHALTERSEPGSYLHPSGLGHLAPHPTLHTAECRQSELKQIYRHAETRAYPSFPHPRPYPSSSHPRPYPNADHDLAPPM